MREEIRTGHTGRSGWALMCRRSAWLARGGPGEHGGMGELLRPVSVIEEDGRATTRGGLAGHGLAPAAPPAVPNAARLVRPER